MNHLPHSPPSAAGICSSNIQVHSRQPLASGQRAANSTRALIILGGCLCVAPPSATVTHAAHLLLRGATVHTITGPDLTPGHVLITDQRIASVGTNLPATDATVVDLNGLHLYPGLIAPHTTLGLIEIEAVRATRDTTEVGDYTPDVLSWSSVNPDSELIPVTRAAGITHFQPIPSGSVVSGQSALLAMTGWTTEDMVVRKSVGLHVAWPSHALDPAPKSAAANPARWKSLEDQARDRQVKLRELEDFFADGAAYHQGRAPGATTNHNPLVPAWEAMRPFFNKEIPLIIHADEIRQIRAAIQWVQRHSYAAALAGGRDAWMAAPELAAAKMPVIYNHVFTLPPRDSASYDVQFAAPHLLHRAGVRVLFAQGEGDQSESASLRNLPYAAAQAVAHGLPETEALKGMTLYPAELFGVADRLGSIEPGKEASLIVTTNPLLDIRSQVTRVWIAGQEVSLENRHTRLYDRYRQRPRLR